MDRSHGIEFFDILIFSSSLVSLNVQVFHVLLSKGCLSWMWIKKSSGSMLAFLRVSGYHLVGKQRV